MKIEIEKGEIGYIIRTDCDKIYAANSIRSLIPIIRKIFSEPARKRN